MLSSGPASHVYFSQRLRLHYVDWGNDSAPPLLLVHGGMDHCRNWDWTAEALRDRYHIIAVDLRGHGDSQWITGGVYHLNDYIYDIAQVIHQKQLAPVSIIAHSLGGAIALRYSGLYPDAVKKLIAIEGMGTRPQTAAEIEAVPIEERFRKGIEETRNISARQPRRYTSLVEACARMQKENPHLSAERAVHLTIHGMNQNEDGTYSWKFDNYLRVQMGGHVEDNTTLHLYSLITAPTLLFKGADSWARDPEALGVINHFKNARVHRVQNAGHWLHHDKFNEFIEVTSQFLKD